MIGFDPMYFMFLGPALLLGIWAQFKVKSAYATASQIETSSRLSGAQVARGILDSFSLQNVGIEPSHGFMSDHYDPKAKMLRLSPEVYEGRSIASLGIAAHEAGHAIQDAQRYAPLVMRNGIVPMASIGSNASWFLLFMGFLLNSMNFIILGIGLFSLVVVFQLINLPVEFDASRRAKELLVSKGFISPQEQRAVAKVLDAAALTYVAATVTAILTLLYYLMRSGLIGGNSRE